MNQTILRNAGIHYEEGLRRFSGVVRLYEKYILRFLEDPTFAQLKEAMEKEDYESAFRHAHTLKGVAGNLSMNTLLSLLTPFVDCLRGQKDIEQAGKSFPAVEAEYEAVIAAIRLANES